MVAEKSKRTNALLRCPTIRLIRASLVDRCHSFFLASSRTASARKRPLRVMSTSKPVGQSYAGEQKRQFAPIFRRRFADGIFGRCPHKAYLFPSLPGKITKVSGKHPAKGKSLGKNKRCKSQDKRQQNSCKLTKFPDSPQIFQGELKIKNNAKINAIPNHFGDGRTSVEKYSLKTFGFFPGITCSIVSMITLL